MEGMNIESDSLLDAEALSPKSRLARAHSHTSPKEVSIKRSDAQVGSYGYNVLVLTRSSGMCRP